MNKNPYESPTADAEEPDQMTTEEFNEILFEIQKNAGSARILGFLGFLIFFCAFMALISGKNALHLIDQYGIGKEFELKAKFGMRLAKIVIWLYLSIVIAFGLFVIFIILTAR